MRTVTLTRTESDDQGTSGQLVTDSGFHCLTLELPWRDNRPSESCISPGEYVVTWRASPRFGFCYHVENVPERTHILFHAANFAGDVKLGFRAELLGCIAPGSIISTMMGQKAILQSRFTLGRLESDLQFVPFRLSVIK